MEQQRDINTTYMNVPLKLRAIYTFLADSGRSRLKMLPIGYLIIVLSL